MLYVCVFQPFISLYRPGFHIFQQLYMFIMSSKFSNLKFSFYSFYF